MSKIRRPARRVALAGVTALALAVAFAMSAYGSPAGGARHATAAAACGSESNFVNYICGKARSANPKLSPAVIGWVNNQGGTVVSNGPEATAAAQLAVNWINKYGDGIDGHPLQLNTCFVKNSEEEGLACADQFLANKHVDAISYGSVTVGANTINTTVAGKKPIIEGFAQNPSDVTNSGTYILFVGAPIDFYAWGTVGQKILHAKTAAVLYAQGSGFQADAEAVRQGLEAVGIKAKLVGYDVNSTDLLGALTAAGAATAGLIAPIGGTPANCISIDKGLVSLGVDPGKVVANFSCALESEKAGYGGDIPKWIFGEAQSGDALTNDAVGVQYRRALAEFGATSDTPDVWYSGMFGSILTIAQFMNKIGYSHLSPQAMVAQVEHFKGPLLLGEPVVDCGKYPSAPANCGDGDHFFKYEGNNKYVPVSKWTYTPLALQKKLHAK
jgi:branched-chain amino acid transport system substrate-binding protein